MASINISSIHNALTIFEEDNYLSQFITTNNGQKSTNNVVQLTVEEQLRKLNHGLKFLENLICDQIHENPEELFKQVTWIQNLESIINTISSQIQDLQSSIERLKFRVVDLFVKIQTQVSTLNNLNAACDLLRKIKRTQSLTLQALDKEIKLSANSMLEIKELIDDKDLKHITFLSKDLIKLSNLYEKNKKYVIDSK